MSARLRSVDILTEISTLLMSHACEMVTSTVGCYSLVFTHGNATDHCCGGSAGPGSGRGCALCRKEGKLLARRHAILTGTAHQSAKRRGPSRRHVLLMVDNASRERLGAQTIMQVPFRTKHNPCQTTV